MHWKQQELDTNTPRLNFLVAYPYCKPDVFEVLKNQTLPYRFLLDSGAFTAHNAGKVITLDDYCRFIETMPIKPWRYFQLDVVGDPEKTARNYEKMLERGFTPVPVFTHNESLSRLDQLYETSDLFASLRADPREGVDWRYPARPGNRHFEVFAASKLGLRPSADSGRSCRTDCRSS